MYGVDVMGKGGRGFQDNVHWTLFKIFLICWHPLRNTTRQASRFLQAMSTLQKSLSHITSSQSFHTKLPFPGSLINFPSDSKPVWLSMASGDKLRYDWLNQTTKCWPSNHIAACHLMPSKSQWLYGGVCHHGWEDGWSSKYYTLSLQHETISGPHWLWIWWEIYQAPRKWQFCVEILGGRATRERFLKGAHGLEKSRCPPCSISNWGNLTVDKSLKMAPNGLKLHRTDKYTLNKR